MFSIILADTQFTADKVADALSTNAFGSRYEYKQSVSQFCSFIQDRCIEVDHTTATCLRSQPFTRHSILKKYAFLASKSMQCLCSSLVSSPHSTDTISGARIHDTANCQLQRPTSFPSPEPSKRVSTRHFHRYLPGSSPNLLSPQAIQEGSTCQALTPTALLEECTVT